MSLLCQLRGLKATSQSQQHWCLWLSLEDQSPTKRARVLWERADFRTGTGNLHNEPGTPCRVRKWHVLKNQTKAEIHNEEASSQRDTGAH